MTATRTSAVLRRARRLVTFGLMLALLSVVVPDAGHPDARFALVKVDGVHGVDASDKTVWILALGSDARPGQAVLGSRADAIQLVGVNAESHRGVTIGIPRDSYVDIPGHGRNKLNAAMVYGGPQAMADAVAGLVGIRPDYVFVTSFRGLPIFGIRGLR
jgi:anionic cell wall polymer biosynthesis LytR-Cps2A-Psr (LCP) family protein